MGAITGGEQLPDVAAEAPGVLEVFEGLCRRAGVSASLHLEGAVQDHPGTTSSSTWLRYSRQVDPRWYVRLVRRRPPLQLVEAGVYLPRCWLAWPELVLGAVLAHEVAHVALGLNPPRRRIRRVSRAAGWVLLVVVADSAIAGTPSWSAGAAAFGVWALSQVALVYVNAALSRRAEFTADAYAARLVGTGAVPAALAYMRTSEVAAPWWYRTAVAVLHASGVASHPRWGTRLRRLAAANPPVGEE